MGNVNDMGVTVTRIGNDDPARVAVTFAGRRVGFDMFGTIPDCRDRLLEALRKLAHVEVNHDVDIRVAELENEGDR